MADTPNILITGAKGIIGTILTEGLQNAYTITPMTTSDSDVRKYDTVKRYARGQSAIIHLARKTLAEEKLQQATFFENAEMFINVYSAALESGVKRVIMASSVHADVFEEWQGPGYMPVDRIPHPTSAYGVEKVSMEAWGRWYASRGLDVVCIRFGAISLTDKAAKTPSTEQEIFLSRRDGVGLVAAILKAQPVPGTFTIVYGVSNNGKRIHDIANPFGWMPQDKAEEYLS